MIAFFSKIVIDIIKATTGRHRPNFTAYCLPINQTTRISISTSCTDGQFIEDFICDSGEFEPFLSFVSGHSTFMTLSMGLTIVYIQYRILWSSCGLFKNLFQFALFAFACYVSVTRVSNYYHFGTDVLSGFLIGLLFVFICCKIVKEILTEEMQNFARLSLSIDKGDGLTFNSVPSVY